MAGLGRGWWSWWGRRWPWFAALGAALFFLAAQQIDLSVGRIEFAGQPAYAVSAVRNQPDAQRAWCVWNNYQVRPPVSSGVDASTHVASDAAACVLGLHQGSAQDKALGDATAQRLVWTYAALNIGFSAVALLLLLAAITAMPAPRSESRLATAVSWPRPRVLAGIALFGSVLQSAAQAVLADHSSTSWLISTAGQSLQFSNYIRWVPTYVLVAVAVVLASLPHVHREPGDRPRLTDSSRSALGELVGLAAKLRLQIVLTLVLVAPLLGLANDQVPDVLLRMSDLDGSPRRLWLGLLCIALTLVALAVLALLLWHSVFRSLTSWFNDRETQPPRGAARTTPLPAPPPLLLLVAGALLLEAAYGWPGWRPLAGLAYVLLAVTGLSWLAGVDPWSRTDNGQSRTAEYIATTRAAVGAERVEQVRVFARSIAAVPIAVLGIEVMRVALPALLVDGGLRYLLLLAAGLLLLVGAALLPTLLATTWMVAAFRPRGAQFTLVGVAAAAWILAALPPTHLAVPALMGAVAATAFFLAAVLVAFNELQRLADRTVPPAGLRLLRVRRLPVFLVLLLWLVIGNAVDTAGPHGVRLLSDNAPAATRTPEQAFRSWMAANCVGSPGAPSGDIPMVFVAASGGGIRAAYWTAAILDDLFPLSASGSGCNVPAATRVFAVSGISGGSLGVVSWLSSALRESNLPWYQRPALAGPDPGGSNPWYERALGIDHLSAVFSWMLYVDGPRALLGFPGDDRAAVLEQSWEDGDRSLVDPFLADYGKLLPDRRAWTPVALLNGAAAESGCQTVTSPLLLDTFHGGASKTGQGGATKTGEAVDPLACLGIPSSTTAGNAPSPAPQTSNLAGDYICLDANSPKDVRRSTAALLSARFPYVTPSGRLANCDDPQVSTYVLDGGYVDGTGSFSAVNLYRQVKPWIDKYNSTAAQGARIRPVFVQIDNGYLSQASGAPPNRPAELLVPPLGKASAALAAENSTSQLAFSAFGGADNYARMADVPTPGVEAPLGWVLSTSARDDLATQAQYVTDPSRRPSALSWLGSDGKTFSS